MDAWNGSPPATRFAPSRLAAKKPGWAATLSLLALAVIVAGIATLIVVELWLAERIIPGVYVWDVDVGGLTRDQAIAHLEATFRYPVDRYPTLRYGDQTWPVEPQYLGTRLDAAATADAALAVGHGGDFAADLREQWDVLLRGRLVMPVFTFDAGTGSLFLSQIARQVNRPMRNAGLVLTDDLTVQVTPAQVGREVDEEATRRALVERLAQMGGGEVELIVHESEPLLADLSAAQAQVERAVGGPITLTAPDFEPWVIGPETLAHWLILKPTTGPDGRTTLSVGLDPALVSPFVDEIAAQVQREPVDAQFRFDDNGGGLYVVADSVPGQTLDITATISLIERLALEEGPRTAPLPLLPVRPTVSSEDGPNLGIVELIGEGVTSYAGSSAAREQNIIVGAAQFDGLLIAPGETFSFNHYLGEVTAEKGYVEGIIIWGNTTRADVGGGLCQVSSTAFRAAFWAGVPIVERWPHAFRVRYYEPPVGMDATIYSPSVDLKWVNDTGHYILIQTYVDRTNKTLTFRFYGTNPGRTVEMDGPYKSNPVPHGPPIYRKDPTLPKGQIKQIEWPKDGLDVTIYRIIKEGGQVVRRDTFFSRYKPWQAVYLVGTRTEE